MNKDGLNISSIRQALKNSAPLLSDVWNISPTLVCLALALRAITAALPVLMLAIGGQLIDALNREHALLLGLSKDVWRLLLIEACMAQILTLTSRYSNHLDLVLRDKLTLHLNLKLIAHCNTLDLETFEDASFQDQLQRAHSQISSQASIFYKVLQATQQLIGLTGTIISALVVMPVLVVVQIIAVTPIALLESHYAQVRHNINKQRTPIRRWLEYILSLVAGAYAFKEIRLFGIGDYFFKEYRRIAEEYNDEDAALSRKHSVALSMLGSFGTLVYYGTYIFLLHDVIIGHISVGRLVFLVGLLRTFRNQLANFFSETTDGLEQLFLLGDVLDIFSIGPVLRNAPYHEAVPSTIRKGIEFKNVSFCYSEGSKNALEKVSFRILPGEMIAIVGGNGSGKSTLLKLLSRLYDPSEGQILIDDIDLRNFDPHEYRQIITAVFQDYVRYDMSAMDYRLRRY